MPEMSQLEPEYGSFGLLFLHKNNSLISFLVYNKRHKMIIKKFVVKEFLLKGLLLLTIIFLINF